MYFLVFDCPWPFPGTLRKYIQKLKTIISSSFMYTRTNIYMEYIDLYCVRLSNTATFCENYAKLYFDAKHLEKGLNRGGDRNGGKDDIFRVIFS